LCFFAGTGFFAGGAGLGVVAVCGSVNPAPSASERLSSTSTVCVMASVPVGAGWPAAGAIVAVCSLLLFSARRGHALIVQTIHAAAIHVALFLTNTPLARLNSPRLESRGDAMRHAISLTGFRYNARP
jgi:hypothetical protein